MRYRALGPDGAIVSAVGLSLSPDPSRPRPADWTHFVYACLENGVNAFELCGTDPVVIEGAAEGLASVDRELVFVSWRLGDDISHSSLDRDFSPESLHAQVSAAIARTGLGRLDALMLDEPSEEELSYAGLAALQAMKTSGAIRYVGVRGQGEAIDAHIESGAFDLLATPFNLTSGWRERNRLRAASQREMAVMGYDPYPRAFHAAAQESARKRPIWTKRQPLDGCGSYAFLDHTPHWSAEEICLAYVLTEPAVATVQLRTASLEHVEKMAHIPERELPPGLAAQIEMARFSPGTDNQTRRRA